MKWLRTLVSGKPHFIIGGADRPYLLRWWLLPRNPWLNLYLHKFLRDDDDRALHDHPWWFVSIILKGAYNEVTEAGEVQRSAPSIAFRPATWRHRVVLLRDADGLPRACWSLVLTGRKSRTWGFWCPWGFRPWHEFTKVENPGEVGRGCE